MTDFAPGDAILPAERAGVMRLLKMFGAGELRVHAPPAGTLAPAFAIKAALEVDEVLSASQLRRYFGARDEDLALYPSVPALLEPVHMRQLQVQTRFYALKEDTLARAPMGLAHLAGGGEGRLALGVPPVDWKVSSGPTHFHDPDAALRLASGRTLAVEYDRGTYTKGKVLKKLDAFEEAGFAGALWLVPPADTSYGRGVKPGRAQNLRELIMDARLDARRPFPVSILTVQWWGAQDVIFTRRGHAVRPVPPMVQRWAARRAAREAAGET